MGKIIHPLQCKTYTLARTAHDVTAIPEARCSVCERRYRTLYTFNTTRPGSPYFCSADCYRAA